MKKDPRPDGAVDCRGRRYCAIGPADDTLDAGALNFDAAQAKAREWLSATPADEDASAGPFTVAQAMDDYIAFLETHRRSATDARYRDRAFIRPKFGDIEVAALSSRRLRRWLNDLTKNPPRLRTRQGEAQKHRELDDGDEANRARRATANRTWTYLKAALNKAWRDAKVKSDAAWRRVEPFEDVEKARVQYLSRAEAKRLLNACDVDFRSMVRAALETGARLSVSCHRGRTAGMAPWSTLPSWLTPEC